MGLIEEPSSRGQFMVEATDLFDSWAKLGKDEGMERGHSKSVGSMLESVFARIDGKFSAIDVGCGNGWVVRKLAAHPDCTSASGVDGAVTMIQKARDIDPDGDYHLAMLPQWTPDSKVDLIHSMEFMYYLDKPSEMLQLFAQNWLNSQGIIVIGVDHYLENEDSHSWSNDLNVKMKLMSQEEWGAAMVNAGFVDLEIWKSGATLCLFGRIE